MSTTISLVTVLEDLGVWPVTETTMNNIARLLREIPGDFLVADEVEHMVYAAVLLDKQGRVEDVLSAHASTEQWGPGLQKHELVWTALYPHLLAHGYRLRARFAPGWRYVGEPAPDGESDYEARWEFYKRQPEAKPEARQSYRAASVECVNTGERKYVKLLSTRARPTHASASEEKQVLQFLNAEPQRSDPHNICVPVHGFVDCPSVSVSVSNTKLRSPYEMVVMPCLRGYEHIAECGVLAYSLDVLQQALEGMVYLHGHGIAHGDIKSFNVVLSDDGPPPKVYFIDFGLATRFRVDSGGPAPGKAESDAFKADVFDCWVTFGGIMFKAYPYFNDLAVLMSAASPDERPSAAECLELFKAALQRLPWHLKFRPAMNLETSYKFGGAPAVIENLRRIGSAGLSFWFRGAPLAGSRMGCLVRSRR